MEKAIAIGRIEYLSCRGRVQCQMEYLDEALMVAEIKECLNYGIPISIVLYRDRDGKTISKKWAEDLNCLPAGFKEIDNPYLAATV